MIHQGTEVWNSYLSDMKLLDSQKTKFYNEIERLGMSPNQFRYTEKAKDTTITFRANENYYFMLWNGGSFPFSCRMSPCSYLYECSLSTDDWDRFEMQFVQWITAVKRESQFEDKWAKLEEMKPDIDISDYESNDKFTFQEYSVLEERMKVLQAGIAKLELAPEQLTALNDSVNRLIEQGKTLGKKDWQNMLLGSIMGVIMTYALSTETAHLIWSLVRQVFLEVELLNP